MKMSFPFRKGSRVSSSRGISRLLAILIALPFLIIDILCAIYAISFGVNSLNFFLFLFALTTFGPALGFLIYAFQSNHNGQNGGWMEVSNYSNINDINRKL